MARMYPTVYESKYFRHAQKLRCVVHVALIFPRIVQLQTERQCISFGQITFG